MNKFIPKTKQPGSHQFPTGGPGLQQTVDSARRGAGVIAPKPRAKAPNVNQGAAPVDQARVKNTGTGPRLGVTTAPTGPQPSGLQKGSAPQLSATATAKPKKRTHPFFGSNALGY